MVYKNDLILVELVLVDEGILIPQLHLEQFRGVLDESQHYLAHTIVQVLHIYVLSVNLLYFPCAQLHAFVYLVHKHAMHTAILDDRREKGTSCILLNRPHEV